MSAKPAFTILELIIVFATLAMVALLGLAGMNNFRAFSQVQQASNALVSDVRSAQNAARNNLLASQVVKPGCQSFGLTEACRLPDAYAIYFDSQTAYSLRACAYTTVAGTMVASCLVEDANLRSVEYGNVKMGPGTTQPNCRGILFERLTGNIKSVAGSSLSPLIQTGQCTISVTGDVGAIRTLVFDLDLDELRLNL